jgi:hypothetical protein
VVGKVSNCVYIRGRHVTLGDVVLFALRLGLMTRLGMVMVTVMTMSPFFLPTSMALALYVHYC